MNRLLVVLAIASLVGCRMCGSSYDHCIPAHTSRTNDDRGSNALYRAGSILGPRDALSNEFDGTNAEFVTDRSVNAGLFGTTTPVELKRPTLRALEPRKLDSPPIGIPPRSATPPPNGRPAEDFRRFDEEILTLPVLPILPPQTVPPSFTPLPFDQTDSQGIPPVTIEELRRLDPTITDLRILNVEDVSRPKTGSQTP